MYTHSHVWLFALARILKWVVISSSKGCIYVCICTRGVCALCAHSWSCVWLLVTPWIVGHQAPLSMEFSRWEYWRGLPFPSPGDLPDPEIEYACSTSPALEGGFFTTEPPGKSVCLHRCVCVCIYNFKVFNWITVALSAQFSHLVMSDSLQPHELQHTRPPCPSLTPGVHPNPCPLCRWCHPTVSSSVVPFFSCLQSFPASGSFQMSQLFASGGQCIGVSASASVLPMNIQGWFPLGWTGWISLQSKGLSRVFSNTTVQKHQFFCAQLSL